MKKTTSGVGFIEVMTATVIISIASNFLRAKQGGDKKGMADTASELGSKLAAYLSSGDGRKNAEGIAKGLMSGGIRVEYKAS